MILCKSQLGSQEILALWLTSALPKSRSNNSGSSASLLPAGIAAALILHQPAAALPRKILKHHPCPRETPVSLKLRTLHWPQKATQTNLNLTGLPNTRTWSSVSQKRWTPKHRCQECTRSWCHFVTSLKKPVKLDPKKTKGNKCHSNSHIAWNNLETSNTGKAQGTEC